MGNDARELIERAIQAFERGDADAFAECFDPQGEFLLPRNLLEGDGYRGPAGARQALADAYETWSAFRIRIDGIEGTADELVVRAHVANTPRRGGPPVDYHATYRVRVGEHGITRWVPDED